MIACPVCEGKTRVVETRATNTGLRRRRYCLNPACTGRVSTIELPVEFVGGHGQYKAADGDLVVISRRRLDEFQRDVAVSAADLATMTRSKLP